MYMDLETNLLETSWIALKTMYSLYICAYYIIYRSVWLKDRLMVTMIDTFYSMYWVDDMIFNGWKIPFFQYFGNIHNGVVYFQPTFIPIERCDWSIIYRWSKEQNYHNHWQRYNLINTMDLRIYTWGTVSGCKWRIHTYIHHIKMNIYISVWKHEYELR